MGKPPGFMDYPRELPLARAPAQRVGDWHEFHDHQSEDDELPAHWLPVYRFRPRATATGQGNLPVAPTTVPSPGPSCL